MKSFLRYSAQLCLLTASWVSVAYGADITQSIRLDIPGQYAHPHEAFASLEGKTISSKAWVDIRIQDGTYIFDQQWLLNHPSGERIRIYGNPKNPSGVIFVFPSDQHGLVVTGKHQLGWLDGVTIRGASRRGLKGIFADLGAHLRIGHVQTEGSYYGLGVTGGSTATVHRIRAQDCGDGCIYAYENGVIRADWVEVQGANDAEENLGFGLIGEMGGTVRVLSGAQISGCTQAGFFANLGGNIWINQGQITRNARGGLVHRNSSANLGIVSIGQSQLADLEIKGSSSLYCKSCTSALRGGSLNIKADPNSTVEMK